MHCKSMYALTIAWLNRVLAWIDLVKPNTFNIRPAIGVDCTFIESAYIEVMAKPATKCIDETGFKRN